MGKKGSQYRYVTTRRSSNKTVKPTRIRNKNNKNDNAKNNYEMKYWSLILGILSRICLLLALVILWIF